MPPATIEIKIKISLSKISLDKEIQWLNAKQKPFR